MTIWSSLLPSPSISHFNYFLGESYSGRQKNYIQLEFIKIQDSRTSTSSQTKMKLLERTRWHYLVWNGIRETFRQRIYLQRVPKKQHADRTCIGAVTHSTSICFRGGMILEFSISQWDALLCNKPASIWTWSNLLIDMTASVIEWLQLLTDRAARSTELYLLFLSLTKVPSAFKS